MEDFYDSENVAQIKHDDASSSDDSRSQQPNEEEGNHEFRPPLSDGSEEFFEKFTPADEIGWFEAYRKGFFVGLGVAAGVAAGVGTTLWILRGKDREPLWRRIFGD